MSFSVSVDFSSRKGAIRPLHGVNNGPKTTGFYRDASKLFREAGIPLCRLHDTEYPFGSGAFVDIPCIFRDFDADVNDPASYDFSQTDKYIQAILDVGAKPLYRLGVSIEHTPVKRNIYAPKDPAKWASICEHIIRHYNEGWKDGMNAGIEYWEIWNEPESGSMWIGSREQYYELYAVTAPLLKASFPNIKIGAYGSCGFYYLTRVNAENVDTPAGKNWKMFVDYAEDFLAMCAEKSLPLDFFSWHLYGHDPEEYRTHAKYVREMLDRHGFDKAESVLDEWNLCDDKTGYAFDDMGAPRGAAFAGSVMTVMQDTAVDAATYYDSQPIMPFCGIFRLTSLTPTCQFYPLKYWNQLYHDGAETVQVETDVPGLYITAIGTGKRSLLLLSHYNASDCNFRISFKGLEKFCSYKICGVDAAHTDGEIAKGAIDPNYPYFDCMMTGYSVYLCEVRELEDK